MILHTLCHARVLHRHPSERPTVRHINDSGTRFDFQFGAILLMLNFKTVDGINDGTHPGMIAWPSRMSTCDRRPHYRLKKCPYPHVLMISATYSWANDISMQPSELSSRASGAWLLVDITQLPRVLLPTGHMKGLSVIKPNGKKRKVTTFGIYWHFGVGQSGSIIP
jgi:hypothetical protein